MKRTGARVKREIVRGLKKARKEAGNGDEVASIDEKLASLTRRACARKEAMYGVPGCGRVFVPELTVDAKTTQRHCSAGCALLAIAHREGWPEKAVAGTVALFTPKTAEEPAVKVRGTSRRVTDRSGALSVGTRVVYTGGSKAGWLPVGAKGVITHLWGDTTLRYGLKFDGLKSTVLGAAFVRPEKA